MSDSDASGEVGSSLGSDEIDLDAEEGEEDMYGSEEGESEMDMSEES